MSIPEPVFRSIQNETKVANCRYEQMQMSIGGAVHEATDMWRARQADFFKTPIAPLMDLSQAARQLEQKIGALNAGQLRWLNLCLEDAGEGVSVREYVVLMGALAQAVHMAKEHWEDERRPSSAEGLIAAHGLKPAARKVLAAQGYDRRKIAKMLGPLSGPGGPRYPALDFLVDRLRLAIEHKAGGRLTFDRKMRSGSLVKVLKLLRPHLDEGLVPSLLPWTAIEEAMRRSRRFAQKKRNI
jgi:hypothetical protein